jgi:pyruvate/2-oxoglutarate dehydrogenase complex dihydrolipoamide dehydrogenase (E3) component
MPSKTLLYSAEVLHLARNSGIFGLRPGAIGFDFQKVMARKARLVREFADCRHRQLRFGRFKFIRANARFVDAHTVELEPLARLENTLKRGHQAALQPFRNSILRAKYFVIATGSVVSPPPLPQLARVGYITSDEALSLKRLPKSLIILGGGAVACELAQFFSRFDVAVTMIQRSRNLLSCADRDAALVLEKVFRREGVRLFTDTQLLDAWGRKGRKGVAFRHCGKTVRVEAEEILFALGRIPNIGELRLERAGVKTEGPLIPANERMQTNARHIYAAGDCTGQFDIVHIAVQQGEIAAHNIANPRRPRRMDYRLFTLVVFSDPQVASVGLTETAAKEKKIPYVKATYPFDDHGKSFIMEAKDGFVKLLANPKTGEIIGGACVGPFGGDLIHEIVTAMAKRMTVHELAAMPHYHPTLSEIWSYPAEELAEKIPQTQ